MRQRSEKLDSLISRLKENSPAIREIDFDGKSIGDAGVCKLARALEGNTTVSKINLRGNNISAPGIKAISSLIEKNSAITCLWLGHNNIDDQGCRYIAAALASENVGIKDLGLDNCNISDQGLSILIPSLRRNLSLSSTDIERNNIKNYELKEVVTELFQSRQELSQRMAEVLQRVKDNDPFLTDVFIDGELIGDWGTSLLAHALAYNDVVTRVCLRGNNITSRGCVAIASALEMNMSIAELWLGHNKICDEGAMKLADVLSTGNSTITTLGLGGNIIGDMGAKSLLSCLRFHNDNITTVDMAGNSIKNEKIKRKLRKVFKMKNRQASVQQAIFIVEPATAETQCTGNVDGYDINRYVEKDECTADTEALTPTGSLRASV